MKKITFIFSLAFIFFGCNSTNTQKNGHSGMIYDYENNPVSKAMFFLDSDYITSTDCNGHFYIDDFTCRNLSGRKIIIKKDHYETISCNAEDFFSNPFVYMKIGSVSQLVKSLTEYLKKDDMEKSKLFLEKLKTSVKEKDELNIYNYLCSIFYYKEENFPLAKEFLSLVASQENEYVKKLENLINEKCFQF